MNLHGAYGVFTLILSWWLILYCICPYPDTSNGVVCVCLRQTTCVPYLTLEAWSKQTNYTIWLECKISDSKTVPGCHYNLCWNHSFVLTPAKRRFFYSLDTLSPCCTLTDLCLLQQRSKAYFFVWRLESVTYHRPWGQVCVLLVFPPSFKIQLDAC